MYFFMSVSLLARSCCVTVTYKEVFHRWSHTNYSLLFTIAPTFVVTLIHKIGALPLSSTLQNESVNDAFSSIATINGSCTNDQRWNDGDDQVQARDTNK